MKLLLPVCLFRGVGRLFYWFIRKAGVNQIRETNNTNNGRKNGPITKYHGNFLQKDGLIVPRINVYFQRLEAKTKVFLRQFLAFSYDEAGFSLMEVVVVSGLLGTMAYLGMGLMENINSGQKDLIRKFEVQNIHEEITQLLKDPINCTTTFENLAIAEELYKDKIQTQVITAVKKVIPKPDEDPIIIERYLRSTKDAENNYNGVSLNEINLTYNPIEGYLDEDNNRAELNLEIKYVFSKTSKESAYTLVKTIPLSMRFAGAKKEKLVICSAYGGSQGGGVIEVIDPLVETKESGKTGEEACESVGKTCQYVQSQNYASNVYGANMHVDLCKTNYNTSTNEFNKGSPVSNVHTCKAKIGVFDTYVINKKDFGITCKGIFMAYCQ